MILPVTELSHAVSQDAGCLGTTIFSYAGRDIDAKLQARRPLQAAQHGRLLKAEARDILPMSREPAPNR